MTPLVFKAVRERCGLTQVQLASWLGFSRNGDRHIRAIEAGDRQPSGPVLVLMHILDGVYTALRDPKSEHHKSAVSLAKRGWLPFDDKGRRIGGDTPDFILANALGAFLSVLGNAIEARGNWKNGVAGFDGPEVEYHPEHAVTIGGLALADGHSYAPLGDSDGDDGS